MTKNNKLLRDVEVFHRLAVYGNRSSFLKSIAQTVPLNENLKQRIESVLNDIPDSNRKAQTHLMDFLSRSDVDLKELYDAVVNASNAVPGDQPVKLQKALDLAKTIREMMKSPETTTPTKESPMVFSPDKITGYRSIPKQIQEKLSDLVIRMGWGMPLQIDGRIGPETRKAIETFKLKNNLGNVSDSELFKAIEKMHRNEFPTVVNLDQAAQSQKAYQESTFKPPGTT